jgi:G3E family GTPase
MPAPRAVPLHLVTGFLGSGKTTLLQRLLRSPALAETAVLVNEFGEIGLDHRLVRHVNERVIVLEGGCACCRMRDDLRDAIAQLFAAASGPAPPFRRIVVETSGLADPAPILYTLRSDYVLRDYVRLAQVITTVDGANGFAQLENQPEIAKQVAVADRIVLTKADISDVDRLGALRREIAAMNPIAEVLDAQTDPLGAGLLLDAEARPGAAPALAAEAPATTHNPDIRSFTLTYDEPLDWTSFAVWLTLLLASRGGQVLRVKGILAVRGSATPVVIHGVQHVMHHPLHLEAWPDADRRSHIVFIARGIEPARLRASLDAFLRAGAALGPVTQMKHQIDSELTG